MADGSKVEVVVSVVDAKTYRREVATEFYSRAAKLTLDGMSWQDALIMVGRDFGLFTNSEDR